MDCPQLQASGKVEKAMGFDVGQGTQWIFVTKVNEANVAIHYMLILGSKYISL